MSPLLRCLSIVTASALGIVACSSETARTSFDDPGATPPGDSDPNSNFTPTTPETPAGSNDPTCAGTMVTLSRSAVYMLVIMDGSGSMNDPLVPNGPEGLKWQAARDAMVAFVDDAEKAKDDAFGVGLFLFDGTQSVADFTATDVGIDFVSTKHASELKTRIKNSTPQGGTPIKRALEGQIAILDTFLPYAPLKKNGKRVLVVMTDGVPDGPSDIQPQVQQQCVDLVEGAHTNKGITTFAVGVGDPSTPDSTYNEVFMGRLAIAGGAPTSNCLQGWSEASPIGSTPCHFQVTPGQKSATQIRDEILAAINAIRGEAASCELGLEHQDGASGVPDPTKVNVAFTDAQGKKTAVPKDSKNGWSFDDDKTPGAVVLHGDACKRLKAETDGKIVVELGCTTRVN